MNEWTPTLYGVAGRRSRGADAGRQLVVGPACVVLLLNAHDRRVGPRGHGAVAVEEPVDAIRHERWVHRRSVCARRNARIHLPL